MNAQIVNVEGLFQEQISYRIPQFQSEVPTVI